MDAFPKEGINLWLGMCGLCGVLLSEVERVPHKSTPPLSNVPKEVSNLIEDVPHLTTTTLCMAVLYVLVYQS